ncbi:MAG: pyruvate dehydrogenase (acetyl-transferring) E1 component subunit alpha [Nitrososphaerota archaeon]|nr:pyruvate dehydrogenase (acetyl-transferring) E1 component subunit alpha [Nitrososphaerota archaeon]MDG6955720.1 pyruvate dehydrogenase (acetyl-transferring) E1 component subunit alpha [Nitrososphaerota archaeon]MDG6960047.1 pyruvate dehydrogenase (acetyl-transferring) E1 component subunit alpha [Nitrososphaerota archaeon]MDG6965065.1 pyruvate dehydrogenase (acetyl-transferring) E1 component subunit alpha [Nitrososphaerota archaeon]MDG6972470.1 pyruvate dehydrogenase (acetyl-transferring) E1 
MTEEDSMKRSGTDAVPRIFSESDFKFATPEEFLFQRLSPDGGIRGKDPNLSPDTLKRIYEQLVFGRLFDDKATNLSTLREIGTYAPGKGQEAAQIGPVNALERGDWYVPMYRDSAGMLAFGMPPVKLLQYWGGDERGMQTPGDLNMLPLAVPVATQLPHAAGLAMAKRLQGEKSVVFVVTGDGGTSKADFHEAMNIAGVYDLPVIFGVENNQWALSVRRGAQTASKTIAQKAVAYGFEGILVDGNDVIASYEATKYAVDKARRGGGPTLIEYSTYRLGPHTTAELVSNKLKAPDEVAEWERRSPIVRFEKYLRSRGLLDDKTKEAVAAAAQDKMNEAIAAYRATPPVDPEAIFDYTYSSLTPVLAMEKAEFLGGQSGPAASAPEPSATGGKPGINIRNAVNMALREGLRRDSRLVIFGEDVAKNGGVFQVTRGLFDEFGPSRVFDTPLAELSIAGIFVGLSIGGMVPVAEFQFDGFTFPAFDQIFSHIARMRNRTRGRFALRGVIRFPYGAGIRPPELHSESPEAYFAHTPGLKVVVPSTPYDAKGLLASALTDPDPVVFMEPKKIYDSPKADVPEEEYRIPIGKASVVRQGNDVTLVSYGAMMVPTAQAAEALQSERSVSAEVVDLRTVSPIDFETVVGSVQKTGRLVVVHEAPRNVGIGAEVAATVAERALDYLKAPVRRVTGYDIPVPLAKLEDNYIPSKERVMKAALDVVGY